MISQFCCSALGYDVKADVNIELLSQSSVTKIQLAKDAHYYLIVSMACL